MFLSIRKLVTLSALLVILFVIPAVLTTCNSPFGFGPPIDWEPPVLTLDPGPNPRYVREGAKLTGSVRDNVSVDRVILRHAGTQKELARAVLFSNNRDAENRWEIDLGFIFKSDGYKNGDKIPVEIVAYDKAGNSGDVSIAAVSLVIDNRPPVIEDIWIQRTPTRTADLEPIYDLKQLETYDPKAENSSFVNRYQNGAFYINAKLSEDETRIDTVVLNIYDDDKDRQDTPLLTLPILESSNAYSPRWIVSEKDILDAGNRAISSSYEADYKNGSRYYYRVEIVATDRGGNESEGFTEEFFVENCEWFCMWQTSDIPKAYIDPVIGDIITKGSTLPVEFFDDDVLLWAYAGMLTVDQWYGRRPVADGLYIQDGTDVQKILWLKNEIVDKGTKIYNWRYDIHDEASDTKDVSRTGEATLISDLIEGKALTEKLLYVQTGNNDEDYGEFKLFTLVADRKFDPHPQPPSAPVPAPDTCQSSWIGRVNDVSVIDENAPLIVFDTQNTSDPLYVPDTKPDAKTGDSPENNTFPALTEVTPGEGGRSFEINGYTLRENRSGNNEVTVFRMAWIPFHIPNGAASWIKTVKDALEGEAYGALDAAGIQYWEIDLIEGTTELIGEPDSPNPYKKQVFRKRFDILGGDDDLKSGYKNFYYKCDETETNGYIENEDKLFIFYAEDNMGHVVFRDDFKLLGMKTPPRLDIYDITKRSIAVKPPNLNNTDSAEGEIYYDESGNLSAAKRKKYEEDRFDYNKGEGFSLMMANVMSGSNQLLDSERAGQIQTYPRDTTLKFWVTAERNGDIAIKEITMHDITYSVPEGETYANIGYYDTGIRSLSYCERLPDITQRVFQFIATDTLGNKAEIQRVVAVTNTAILTEIDANKPGGTYGISRTINGSLDMDTVITLQARFSSPVRWQGTARPMLNIRYEKDGSFVIEQIETKTGANTDVLALEFDFVVNEGYEGKLEVMFSNHESATGDPETDRPISLTGGTRIIDSERGDDAFTPRNSATFDWIGEMDAGVMRPPQGALQAIKTIELDGIHPVITGPVIVAGKIPYQTSPLEIYFKTGETISFTVNAGEAIQTGGGNNPRIRFYIRQPAGAPAPEIRGPYYADWQRASGSAGMVFSFEVAASGITPALADGEIVNISLNTGEGTIVDNVGNPLIGTDSIRLEDLPLSYNGTTPAVYIDQTPPAAPVTLLENAAVTDSDVLLPFNQNPTLQIDKPVDPLGIDRIEYSLNGGLTWKEYDPYDLDSSVYPGWTVSPGFTIVSGSWNLRTRCVDRAGNIGTELKRPIEIKVKFPDLKSVSAVQANGWYTSGSSLQFDLNFEDNVTLPATGTVSMTLTGLGGDSVTQVVLNRVMATQQGLSTIRFTWNIPTGYEMREGLYISAVDFTGLSDTFGNTGESGTAATPGGVITITESSGTYPSGNYTCNNINGASLKVDSIAPTYTTVPDIENVSTDRRTITLSFREPVIKGSGEIIVRPRGNYAIPAVFENDEFYNIYNNGALNATQRGYLTQGNSMSNLALNERTGQSAGPYMNITHGLKPGEGYTGDYSNTVSVPHLTPTYSDGPNPQTNTDPFMIPDTNAKWVLSYQYRINDTTEDSAVSRIRAVLSAAEFRWQKFDVTSTSVFIPDGSSVVTITLPELLLEGLQWDIYFPDGTFTDLAGNPALGFAYNETNNTSAHWFWSSGVQPPVIRVNRRSFDARDSNWAATTRAYVVPADTDGWGTGTLNANIAVTDDNGWGINDFNYIHYRIESETPGATVYSSVHRGTTANKGAVIAAWTGTVQTANADAASITDNVNWNAAGQTFGTWVLSNLIRRAGTGGGANAVRYTVTEKGLTRERLQTNAAAYQGFRSYNKDLKKSELDGVALTQFTNAANTQNQGVIQFDALEASKSYVIAYAQVSNGGTTYSSSGNKSYEGVFRSVLALNQNTFGGWLNNSTASNNHYRYLVEGSNVKNGMPTIAGFPVRDAEETGDNRFIKMFWSSGNAAPAQFYWVSTEIVSQWFELTFGSTHQQTGEFTNYLTAGYGDLTYSYNQR